MQLSRSDPCRGPGGRLRTPSSQLWPGRSGAPDAGQLAPLHLPPGQGEVPPRSGACVSCLSTPPRTSILLSVATLAAFQQWCWMWPFPRSLELGHRVDGHTRVGSCFAPAFVSPTTRMVTRYTSTFSRSLVATCGRPSMYGL